MGTTNLVFWNSPTYTAMCPFGTSVKFLAKRDCSLTACLALRIMDGKRIPISDSEGKLKKWARQNIHVIGFEVKPRLILMFALVSTPQIWTRKLSWHQYKPMCKESQAVAAPRPIFWAIIW
ncbi:hypothetical protein SLEP1_g33726 [Rubroshorea leprosula]|nr:hypothetical protein SLEP1_g33726 [Rubroshorea leprosula]